MSYVRQPDETRVSPNTNGAHHLGAQLRTIATHHGDSRWGAGLFWQRRGVARQHHAHPLGGISAHLVADLHRNGQHWYCNRV